MPTKLASPVLALSIDNIAKVDPQNVDNLFGMWTIFSRCADSLENGRRLENMSWRLWNQKALQLHDSTLSSSLPINHPPPSKGCSQSNTSSPSEVPGLSSSVESAASECEAYMPLSEAVNIQRRPSNLRRESSDRSRPHLTPENLAKVMNFKDSASELEQWRASRAATSLTQESPKQLVSLTATSPEAVTEPLVGSSASESIKSSPESSTSPSESNASVTAQSPKSTHSIVRGFSPSTSSSYRSKASMARGSPAAAAPEPKKAKKSMFFIASSPSDGDGSSYGDRGSYPARPDRSFLSDGLRRNIDKKTSFRDEVSTRTVFDEDDGDSEDSSESAIEDDDSSDWDSVDESSPASYEEPNLFQRVDSKPNLASRRSLLSTLLHEPQRAEALRRAAASQSSPALHLRARSARTTSHNGPSLPPSPSASLEPEYTHGAMIPSKPIPTRSIAFSPRTTRRNMLATELTESLRQNLIWERSHKEAAVTAALKRRHTAHDMTQLAGAHPAPTDTRETSKINSSWNYFDHGLNEYHAAGW